MDLNMDLNIVLDINISQQHLSHHLTTIVSMFLYP